MPNLADVLGNESDATWPMWPWLADALAESERIDMFDIHD